MEKNKKSASKTKEIKISEILHLATDKYLSPSLTYAIHCDSDSPTHWFSCWAVEEATREYLKRHKNYCEKVLFCIEKGLQAMGCDTNSTYLFEDSFDPQGDRYMWLKFAAIIAEEQEAAGYKLEI